jgi:hypothetical protein
MAVGLGLNIFSRSQLRESLTDVFQKLTFVRETIHQKLKLLIQDFKKTSALAVVPKDPVLR